METERQEGQPVIEGQQIQETADRNLLNRLAAWCRNLVRTVLPKEGNQQRESQIEARKESLLAEIEQINIEELCSLSPEEFLGSPQFFKLIELYNLLFHAEAPITSDRLQNNMVARLVVDGVLIMFVNLRSILINDLPRARTVDQFRTRVLEYLDERGGQQKKVREESVSPSRDEPLGVPDTIRRFNRLGVVLQVDDDAHGDWYVFVDGRRYIVKSSYGLELHRMNRGQMVLIERAFRARLLNAEEFTNILEEGRPCFNELMGSIIDRLSQI